LKNGDDLEEYPAMSKRKGKAEDLQKAVRRFSFIGFGGLRRQWRHGTEVSSEKGALFESHDPRIVEK
jgi:hypothetical protein